MRQTEPINSADPFGLVNLAERMTAIEEKHARIMRDNEVMRKACRDTNRGIQRLRKNCNSQRKKLDKLKAAAPELWAQLFPPQPQSTGNKAT